MAFGQIGGKNEGKDCNHFGADWLILKVTVEYKFDCIYIESWEMKIGILGLC